MYIIISTAVISEKYGRFFFGVKKDLKELRRM